MSMASWLAVLLLLSFTQRLSISVTLTSIVVSLLTLQGSVCWHYQWRTDTSLVLLAHFLVVVVSIIFIVAWLE